MERKLETWVKAGIIDSATAERISAFEAAKSSKDRAHRPVVLYALGGLGAVTIGIGIVSVVASNWDGIGAGVKLAVNLLLGLALALGTRRASVRGAQWATEVLVIVSYLYALASLALVGQVYQTGTPTAVALSVWSVATLPLVFLGRSVLLGFILYAGIVTTLSFDVKWLLEALAENWAERVSRNVAFALAWVVPIGLLALSMVLALGPRCWSRCCSRAPGKTTHVSRSRSMRKASRISRICGWEMSGWPMRSPGEFVSAMLTNDCIYL